MIISASRRTDIPAFYSKWFINRIRAGFCTVPNPFNPAQISNISLTPENVDVIVFWTRNPGPIIPYLKELNQKGYRYYFLYTLMDNPKLLDPKSPSIDHSLNIFKKLSDLIGPQKVIWRYDPIVLSNITDIDFHKKAFEKTAESLCGYTLRCIISFVEIYRKIIGRFIKLSEKGFMLNQYNDNISDDYVKNTRSVVPAKAGIQNTFNSPGSGLRRNDENGHFPPFYETIIFDLSGYLAQISAKNNIQIQSCALKKDLGKSGILPGKCIDDDYINKVFGLNLDLKKDPFQRKECGCVASKDIGMYNSCLYECQYCYATVSFEKAGVNYRNHDPFSSSLL